MAVVDSTNAGQFALDVQALDSLRHRAARRPEEGLQEAATQFEAMFIQMTLKSMRDTVPESDLMNSQQSQFYQGLMDQQWSQQLAERGIGLAEQLTAQLSGQVGSDGPRAQLESENAEGGPSSNEK